MITSCCVCERAFAEGLLHPYTQILLLFQDHLLQTWIPVAAPLQHGNICRQSWKACVLVIHLQQLKALSGIGAQVHWSLSRYFPLPGQFLENNGFGGRCEGCEPTSRNGPMWPKKGKTMRKELLPEFMEAIL